MFSRRAAWDLRPNPLAERVAARRALGLPFVDLADANPTRAGFAGPAEAMALALGDLARDGRALGSTPIRAAIRPPARRSPPATRAPRPTT